MSGSILGLKSRRIRGTDISNALGGDPLLNLIGKDASNATVSTGGTTQTVAGAIAQVSTKANAAATTISVNTLQSEVDGFNTQITNISSTVNDLNSKLDKPSGIAGLDTNGLLKSDEINLSVSDGTTSIAKAHTITFAGGATVSGGTGEVIVTLPAGGGGGGSTAKQWPFGLMPAESSFSNFLGDSNSIYTSADNNSFSIKRTVTSGNLYSLKGVPVPAANNYFVGARISSARLIDGNMYFGVALLNSATNMAMLIMFGGGRAYMKYRNISDGSNDVENYSFGFCETGFGWVDCGFNINSALGLQGVFSTDGLQLDDTANKSWAKLTGLLANHPAAINATHFCVFLNPFDSNETSYFPATQYQASCASLVGLTPAITL